MLNSNTPWLVPEIMDVVRLFDCEDRDFTHYFYFERDNYINCIEYGGEVTEYHYAQPTADDIEFKRYAKRSAKLAFYELLHSVTGRSFPYGALTGIRPTKLAYMETEEGRDFKDLFFQMHVLPENIDFVGRVIKTQRPYYAKKGGQELFISLPFCPTKCSYCSFITAPISSTKKYVDAYISCVERELASLKPILSNVNSVYIGGGTPFCIEEEGLERQSLKPAPLRVHRRGWQTGYIQPRQTRTFEKIRRHAHMRKPPVLFGYHPAKDRQKAHRRADF